MPKRKSRRQGRSTLRDLKAALHGLGKALYVRAQRQVDVALLQKVEVGAIEHEIDLRRNQMRHAEIAEQLREATGRSLAIPEIETAVGDLRVQVVTAPVDHRPRLERFNARVGQLEAELQQLGGERALAPEAFAVRARQAIARVQVLSGMVARQALLAPQITAAVEQVVGETANG